jgi:hypothetical protein
MRIAEGAACTRFTAVVALSAVSESAKRTKPKPLHSPVFLRRLSRTLNTSPATSNACWTSSSLASGGKPPTKTSCAAASDPLPSSSSSVPSRSVHLPEGQQRVRLGLSCPKKAGQRKKQQESGKAHTSLAMCPPHCPNHLFAHPPQLAPSPPCWSAMPLLHPWRSLSLWQC